MPQCFTMSATDRNFSASANSKNPSVTFTLFIQEPDFGRLFNQAGNIANSVNGNANAKENPNIPTNGCIGMTPNKAPAPDADCTKRLPIIGPVQEKETIAKVNAIKKMPIKPPRSAALSDLLAHELGKVISKTPKKEMANITNKIKKATFIYTFVAISFKMVGPNIPVRIVPILT